MSFEYYSSERSFEHTFEHSIQHCLWSQSVYTSLQWFGSLSHHCSIHMSRMPEAALVSCQQMHELGCFLFALLSCSWWWCLVAGVSQVQLAFLPAPAIGLHLHHVAVQPQCPCKPLEHKCHSRLNSMASLSSSSCSCVSMLLLSHMLYNALHVERLAQASTLASSASLFLL